MMDKSEAALRRKAARRANAKLGFRWHLVAFVVINAGLIAINFAMTPDSLWFYWPMGGWLIGLIAHGYATYSGGDVREDMIQAEMDRLRARER